MPLCAFARMEGNPGVVNYKEVNLIINNFKSKIKMPNQSSNYHFFTQDFGVLLLVILLVFFLRFLIRWFTGKSSKKVVKTKRRKISGTNCRNIPGTQLPVTAPFETVLRSDVDGFVVSPQIIQGSSVVVPPYPVEARHPTPENKSVPAPGPGFATYNPPYPTHNPHPVPDVDYCAPLPIGISPAPYPPPGPTPYPPAGPPNSAPYPSYPGHDSQPPSYSEAVGQPSAQPLIPKEGYTKQAPYNPNY
nr:PREDICTED: inverted formin-2-like isoform X2 [Tribolium castaneum]|eukprot:XP_015837381.1 PREDICTED: inverted formin-2-like isoform X2 [Tribolium castaneum]